MQVIKDSLRTNITRTNKNLFILSVIINNLIVNWLNRSILISSVTGGIVGIIKHNIILPPV